MGFELRRATAQELNAAIGLVMQGARLGPSGIAIENFINYLQLQKLKVDCCHIVVHQDRLLAACVGIVCPGQTMTCMLSALPHDSPLLAWLEEAVHRLMDDARASGVNLIQFMTPQKDAAESKLLARVGFRYLAELKYMSRGVHSIQGSTAYGPSRLTFRQYDPGLTEELEQILKRTYLQSLDCPGLTEMRTMADVLASHQSTGRHDPALWLIALEGKVSVGVLLLTHGILGSSLEIVYMGVLPEFRGRGYGQALVQQAIKQARQQKADIVTLAVDVRNQPALEIYQSLGFIENDRRHAWVYSVNRPND